MTDTTHIGLREKIARAIVQVDERNGGPCWDHIMAMGKHVVSAVWERADEVLALVGTLTDAEAIMALPTPSPDVNAGAAVKALGWITCGPVAFASMPFGSYEVEQLEEKLFVIRTRTGLLGVPFETEELARAAAQADYEKRILSALTSPQGEETPAAPSPQADVNAPRGWRLVPLVPTQYMIDAWRMDQAQGRSLQSSYVAMIAASESGE